ncbi:MAG TPA: glycosyltransferase family 39 protein [Vicinamibacterales bacterium]|nr:glycosyltransferase family 39 protein [Vicinamibacterales bacterium]
MSRPDSGAHHPLARMELLAIAGATLLLHAAAGARYGYFRDELYYLACSDHLALGYVDHPPLSIAVLRLARLVLGDSLWAIRLPAWLAAAATVFVTGLLARQIGGARFAQILAALCVVVGPVYLGVGHFFSMNALDLLFWSVSALAFVHAISSTRPAWWVALGVLLGLGLLNKISVLWLGAGMAAVLLLTGARRHLTTAGPWLTAAIAGALFLPHVVWQIQHGWPTLEFIENATTRKMSPVAPLEFLANQIVVQHPITLPVWTAGLLLLFRRGGQRLDARALVWLFVVPAAILLVSGTARANYLSPAFPMIFAAGAVAIERMVQRQWLRAGMVVAIVAAGAVTAPAGLPVLPVETFIRYAAALRLAPRAEEKTRVGLLPQHYADQFGWPELAREVSAVYAGLSPDERGRCAILATNYGRAGAIDFFGRELGLPRAISGHNSYYLWGPRDYTGDVMIIVGGSYEDHAPDFEQVVEMRAVRCRYCMPYEDGVRIFVCRRLKMPLRDAWRSIKDYI